jgi:hypothetical protein
LTGNRFRLFNSVLKRLSFCKSKEQTTSLLEADRLKEHLSTEPQNITHRKIKRSKPLLGRKPQGV